MNDELLKANGFDAAILGIDYFDLENPRLIYSIKRCMEILREEGDWESDDEILEYINFNMTSAYVGKKTPIWCWDIEEIT